MADIFHFKISFFHPFFVTFMEKGYLSKFKYAQNEIQFQRIQQADSLLGKYNWSIF